MTGDQSKKYLSELVDLTRKSKQAIGYQKLVVGALSSLTIPVGATYCEMRIESTNTTAIVLRYLFLNTATPPSTTDGMALTHLDLFDILNNENMNNFRIIPAVAGTHTLHIQYYK